MENQRSCQIQKIPSQIQTKTTEPTWNFLQFSIFFRLYKFLFTAKSGPGHSVSRQRPRTRQSRFLGLFRKSKTPETPPPPVKRRVVCPNNNPNPQHQESKFPVNRFPNITYKEPICVGSLLMGTLALISESVYEKDQKGIVIHGLSFLLFLVLLFKRYVTGRVGTLLLFSTVGPIICALICRLDKYMNCGPVHILELVRKA